MLEISHLSLQKPPEILFHAVPVDSSDQAFWNGLKRKKTPLIRLYKTEEEARRTIRKQQPFTFAIMAELMAEDGFHFFLSDEGEWYTDEVPSKYLRLC